MSNLPNQEHGVEGDLPHPVGTQVLPALKTPDISPAQIVAGIPILADLLHAWGVYSMSDPQQESLERAVTWGFVLIGGDAVIRLGRAVGKAIASRR